MKKENEMKTQKMNKSVARDFKTGVIFDWASIHVDKNDENVSSVRNNETCK